MCVFCEPLLVRVKNRRCIRDRFWDHVRKTKNHWIWTGQRDRKDYGRLRISGERPRVVLAHRLSWAIARGGWPPDDRLVCHKNKCNTPHCVRPTHLYLGTYLSNNRDTVAIGHHRRAAPGARHHNAVLTARDVRRLFALSSAGALQRELAERFGVKQQTIGDILRGKKWRHLARPCWYSDRRTGRYTLRIGNRTLGRVRRIQTHVWEARVSGRASTQQALHKAKRSVEACTRKLHAHRSSRGNTL